MTENDRDLQGTVVAAELAIAEGEYNRAEQALTDALGRVRKRQAGGAADD
jgi:hypothetical protein